MSRSLPKPKRVVDLHAETLLDNWEDYQADELLRESIDHLREQLDAAIYWEYPEIHFIHGRGRGVLRDVVYSELRSYQADGLVAHFHPSYSNPDVVIVVLAL